jgi:WD40 repeat protein
MQVQDRRCSSSSISKHNGSHSARSQTTLDGRVRRVMVRRRRPKSGSKDSYSAGLSSFWSLATTWGSTCSATAYLIHGLDFLRSKERSLDFHIRVDEANERLTNSLFDVMERSLRFNICNLETSYKRNSDVEDLDERITKNIPLHLDYACRYWTDHIYDVSPKGAWLDRVNEFMHNQLLFWFEVLSLIKKMSVGVRQLSRLQHWLMKAKIYPIVEDLDENTKLESQENTKVALDLKPFVKDATRFAANYGRVAEESTPHLYLSVLPFVPRTSPLSGAYLSRFPGCIRVHDNHKIRWPQESLTTEVASGVNAAALSYEGKRVVSGSSDKIVRIWDAETGETITGPFRGHTHYVTLVGFSHDGKRIVSGSDDKTVRIWYADIGITFL